MQGLVDVCFSQFEKIEAAYIQEAHSFRDLRDVEIAPEIRFTKLTTELRENIAMACSPHGFQTSHTPCTLSQGIVRENATGDYWDQDAVLSTVLALSRVIHPSTIGTAFAARLRFSPEGELLEIRGVKGGERAYKPTNKRWWLTNEECEALGRLYRAYVDLPRLGAAGPFHNPPKRRLPVRLQRALWNFAEAAYIKHSHIRWLLVATALEGMIKGDKNPTQTFYQRVFALSEEVDVPLTKNEIKKIYSLRSHVAHSGWFADKKDGELDASYIPMDRLVAGVISKAIYDGEFRMIFNCEEALDDRWPVVIKDKYCKCGLVIPRS